MRSCVTGWQTDGQTDWAGCIGPANRQGRSKKTSSLKSNKQTSRNSCIPLRKNKQDGSRPAMEVEWRQVVKKSNNKVIKKSRNQKIKKSKDVSKKSSSTRQECYSNNFRAKFGPFFHSESQTTFINFLSYWPIILETFFGNGSQIGPTITSHLHAENL